MGLSPRMRGNPPYLRISRSAPRISSRVYPRACGGTCGGSGAGSTWRGLSPRMRGNLVAGRVGLYVLGSIPAHAGEPSTVRTMRARSRVYPRACGGTACVAMVQTLPQGSIPAHAGEPPPALDMNYRKDLGSIPAHAGEPGACIPRSDSARVYPRACGGTRSRRSMIGLLGVYPRACGVTGGAVLPGYGRSGSIPAHAGEPPAPAVVVKTGLSPRMRGNHMVSGLSPRMRGNTSRMRGNLRDRPVVRDLRVGLSPRMRGNRGRSTFTPIRVYPRACGGSRRKCACVDLGSIPAHAGEPQPSAGSRRWTGVYPRACGGTPAGEVRGPRHGVYPRACGGTRLEHRSLDARVYPRACGGTLPHYLHSRTDGVYPRACGGTPGAGIRPCGSRVYPRACGGT